MEKYRDLPDIFDYQNPSAFLVDVHERIKRRNPRYSLRAWAFSLSLKSPTTLFRVLNNERRIPVKLIGPLSISLGLSPFEAAYFEVLSVGHKRLSQGTLDFLKDVLKQGHDLMNHSVQG